MRQTDSFRGRLRRAVCVSAGMTVLLLVVRFIVLPLHERGVAQPALAAVGAVAQVIEFPGYAAAGVFQFQAVKQVGGVRWWMSLVSNFALYTAALMLVAWLRKLGGTGYQPASSSREKHGLVAHATRNPSRRELFRRGARFTGGVAAAGGLGYSLFVEPRELSVTRRRFAIRDLPPQLAGLRVVQISDVHHGPWLSLEFVRRVIGEANALRGDIVLLTGDYVYESPSYIEPVIGALAELRAGIGIVGVLGNHDWYEGGAQIRRGFARVGIPLIDNSRVILTPGRTLVRDAAEGLCLAGVGDLWEDRPDYHAALADLPAAMPRLLLSHNPDAAEDARFLAAGHRVDLMISGHTHGGQVRLPLIGAPILPSRYGQKYAQGLVQGPACRVFVSRGVGLSGLPLRFGVPPEIVLMELQRA